MSLRIAPRGLGLEPGPPGARPRRPGGRVLGGRHRHRHPAEQAAPHLRGVPAGRRHHQPRVRRHRAWACRSAASSRACSAARSASRARRARAARSRSTCRSTTGLPADASWTAAAEPPRSSAGANDRLAPVLERGRQGDGRAAGRRARSPAARCWWSTTTSATCSRMTSALETARHAGAARRERQGGHRDAQARARRRPRPDGRDDAGARRPRHHAHRAQPGRLPRRCRSSR